MLKSLFNKAAGLTACNFIIKETPTLVFPVNIEIFLKTWLAPVAASVNLTLSLIDIASIVLIIISVTDRNKTCHILIGLLIKNT